ncbi:hypothetical protein Hte_000139 [Hypoxylon texense]
MEHRNEPRNSNVQLLAALVDLDDEDDGDYRFLVDDKRVVYVTVEPGALPKDDRTFGPVLIPTLPSFPAGDWNEGHVSGDELTGHLIFSRNVKRDLPGIKSTWHPTHIDYLELKQLNRIRQNVHEVTHPLLDRPGVVKFAPFPWQILYFEAETTAYEWIDGTGIGPRFLGDVTEAGRVIAFVVYHIDGARTAGPEDLEACQGILARLHSLGIGHGDINKHNFLVRNGEALLIDFEAA